MKAKQLKVYQLYTRTPHDKLLNFYTKLQCLFSKEEPEIMLLFTAQEPFGHCQKAGRCYSLQQIKSCLECLINSYS